MKFGLALSIQHPPEDFQVERFRDHLETVLRSIRLLGKEVLPPLRAREA